MNNDKLINYKEIDIKNIDINDIVIIINKKDRLKYFKGYIIYIENTIITLANSNDSIYTDYDENDYIIYKKMWNKNRKIKLIEEFKEYLESENCKFLKKKLDFSDSKSNNKEKINKKKIIDISLIEKLDLD